MFHDSVYCSTSCSANGCARSLAGSVSHRHGRRGPEGKDGRRPGGPEPVAPHAGGDVPAEQSVHRGGESLSGRPGGHRGGHAGNNTSCM